MNSAQRLRATYNLESVDHLYRREFYIWNEALCRWKEEGMPPINTEGFEATTLTPGEYPVEQLADLFGYDHEGDHPVHMLGWVEPAIVPPFEAKVVESTEKFDIVRDEAGRLVRFFKGKRHGFMPTYLKHAVACDKDWEEDIAPLLSPDATGRWDGLPQTIDGVKAADAEGKMISQRCIGGYMYLRSLVGPEDICYMFIVVLCHFDSYV